MSDIKGVPQSRLDRLWKHLLKVEELTGKNLRKSPRETGELCPMNSFAPYRDIIKGKLKGVGFCSLWYCDIEYNKYNYQIWEYADSLWWGKMPYKTRHQITKWVIQKIKERG